MRTYSILAIVAVMSIFVSCRKYQMPGGGHKGNGTAQRKVRYELYAGANLAGDTKNIHFSVFIRNGQNTIFDSALAVMKVEDIPDFAHRIIIEKLVPGNDPATLTVGFNYAIDNVGNSWFVDAFNSGESLKILSYPFK